MNILDGLLGGGVIGLVILAIIAIAIFTFFFN